MEQAIVAQFQRFSGRIWLWSLTVIAEETTRHGTGLMRKTYDVEYSKRYGYMFDQSGAGGSDPVIVSGLYFTSGNVTVRETPSSFVTRKARRLNPTRRLRILPGEFISELGTDLLGWLERNAIQQDSVWCSECRDRVLGQELCEHCWWCEKIGWYSTPSDRCGHERTECEG
jgi:hypothetical protein